MKLERVGQPRRQPGPGLSGLEGVPLGFNRERMLDTAIAGAGGPAPWRLRKISESHDLLALSRIAPDRMSVEQLDLSEELRAVIRLRAPVPTRKPGSDELIVVDGALLGLRYFHEALLTPQPGSAFVQILQPVGVFLPQVPSKPPFCLCLAPVLPPGIPCKELVLMSYNALSMQNYQIDPGHPGGVFGVEAAEWFQANVDRIPLTREPFLSSPEPAEGS